MKLKLIALVLFSALFSFNINAQKAQIIKGQFIVELKEEFARPVIKNKDRSTNRLENFKATTRARSQNLAKIREVLQKSRISSRSVVAQYADVMVGFTARLSDAQIKVLRANPAVQGVYPDYYVNLRPIRVGPLKPIKTQKTPCAVTQAGGFKDGSNKATWIWILDTGIDMDHPDLNVQTSATFARSFISGQSADDGEGHGTHVAGIAGAKNNFFGVVGVSAGAKVVPVKVLSNTGSGSWTSLISGLNHVASYDIPGDVINMSLGAYGYSNCQNSNPTLRNAIRNLGLAGTWVVMAAGNDSGDANQNLPGCINGTRVYTVGALDCGMTCASYSNWGSSVDWAAVGTGVYSTYKNKGYTTKTGTSMASPVVAGIIHARGGAPVSGGTVNCGGTVRIAKR